MATSSSSRVPEPVEQTFSIPTAVTETPSIDIDLTTFDTTKTDDKNRLLIVLKNFRVGGPPINGLLHVCAMAITSHTFPELPYEGDLDERNLHHLRVMNTLWTIVRDAKLDVDPSIFDPGANTAFASIGKTAAFNTLLSEILEKHLESKAGGGSEADWRAIQAKVAAIEHKEATRNFSDPPLSAAERKMLAKNRAIKAADTGPKDAHYQNENAVCYPSLIIHIAGLVALEKPAYATFDKYVDTLLIAFAYIHHKLHESYAKAIAEVNMAPCIHHGMDIQNFWKNVLTSKGFCPSESSKRMTPNSLLTMNRLLRITSMVTGLPSVWGIGIHWKPEFIDVVLKMSEIEKKLNDKLAPASHSIVWYLTLGKQKIINPLTDDQTQSAETVIANTIGKTARDIRIRPNCVPFSSAAAKKRTFPKIKKAG